MTDFKSVFADIKSQVETLVTNVAAEFKADAVKGGKLLLKDLKVDLERWVELLNAGQLKPEEFKWLVKSNTSLTKMAALKQAGMATVEVKKFAGKLLYAITETAIQASSVKNKWLSFLPTRCDCKE